MHSSAARSSSLYWKSPRARDYRQAGRTAPRFGGGGGSGLRMHGGFKDKAKQQYGGKEGDWVVLEKVVGCLCRRTVTIHGRWNTSGGAGAPSCLHGLWSGHSTICPSEHPSPATFLLEARGPIQWVHSCSTKKHFVPTWWTLWKYLTTTASRHFFVASLFVSLVRRSAVQR